MRFAYPYELTAQPEGGFTVSFPDVPEAITQGDTEEEAVAMAEDALVTALSFYTDDTKPLPHPSPARGRRVAHVPPLVAAKLVLHDVMVTSGVSNVELAFRLGVDERIVRRLRDPLYKNRIDRVDKALRVLGKRIDVVVSEVDRQGENIVPFQKQKNDSQQAACEQKMRIDIAVREAADSERGVAVLESRLADRPRDNIDPFQKRKNDMQQAARRQKMQAKIGLA
jgi:antitoxin HicB